MSDPNRKSKAEDETVCLNLAQFAPGHKAPPTPPSEEGMTIMIERAAAEVASGSQPVVSPKGAPPPKEMLGAVAYSYAKGVYRSEDIARKMGKDPEFSGAVGENLPDANSIRRFRRLNREAIKETLARVFRRQRKRAATETLSQTMPGAEPAVQPSPKPPGPDSGETTIISRRDAEAKIDQAAWVDNMSKDD